MHLHRDPIHNGLKDKDRSCGADDGERLASKHVVRDTTDCTRHQTLHGGLKQHELNLFSPSTAAMSGVKLHIIYYCNFGLSTNAWTTWNRVNKTRKSNSSNKLHQYALVPGLFTSQHHWTNWFICKTSWQPNYHSHQYYTSAHLLFGLC